jgi:carbonic anhydrase
MGEPTKKYYYQSPIQLNMSDAIQIEQCLHIHGANKYSKFDKDMKIFIVTDNIILKIGDKMYKLKEYHFHLPCEHHIGRRKHEGEIHYVFIECDDKRELVVNDNDKQYGDLCGCNHNYPNNTLVIGRLINNDHEDYTDFNMLQVKIPSCYYEYDGTLTTGDYAPVRWIVGKNPINLNIKQLSFLNKPARPLQNLDGRIVLYSD